ncbi:sugar kinase [Paracoccus laeviglucosivorans]|uniref:2-keto-3-deoxygluconate kinase n=1 Tax=Paracoccus laeviglucosivorans TaxID=1197861 RepID=A0A521DJJ9_9RHOB|nr:sugar kinase [Paracoccus laeviglucosivorans]SMO71788.1 2-keto-3-deoxygluconate kinase [Paracoccus laeviglucosivorans]
MRVVSVGECMVELSGAGQGLWRQAFAGDTFNTAWYLRALMPGDAQVDYLTCVGRDGISQAMLDFIAGAGIGTDCITCHPTRAPGLYMIDLKDGERSFTYWRDSSAARCLADDPDHLARSFEGADLIYFSGITLAILTPDRRQALLAALKAAPGRVAFDSNMRLRLWSDRSEMCDWIARAAAVANIALPSFEEESQFFGDAAPRVTAERYLNAGASEILVKNGGEDMLGHLDGQWLDLPCGTRVTPVDTTGAGDSFNGGYLSARLAGLDMAQAAQRGHATASRVVMQPGALIARDMLVGK